MDQFEWEIDDEDDEDDGDEEKHPSVSIRAVRVDAEDDCWCADRKLDFCIQWSGFLGAIESLLAGIKMVRDPPFYRIRVRGTCGDSHVNSTHVVDVPSFELVKGRTECLAQHNYSILSRGTVGCVDVFAAGATYCAECGMQLLEQRRATRSFPRPPAPPRRRRHSAGEGEGGANPLSEEVSAPWRV